MGSRAGVVGGFGGGTGEVKIVGVEVLEWLAQRRLILEDGLAV